ncbi:hypothetical protein CRE_02882 [Caenorhabditis remanei]|uniref:Uncharacterized protein n=1 Tax=Caenorhabditis remanei TaxID=31234 RepID=E3LWF9_CAERE|nr:hypothetical protein CRE_02882 [Caenorhabditis remanei]
MSDETEPDDFGMSTILLPSTRLFQVKIPKQMCSHVFPALYLNLGVEMMYVLDQRLRVQKERIEDREKSDKVVKEIMLGFLAKQTLDEVFKGHGTPTRAGLKMFFEKVAHCSIMRLNENSMDKLFDLMMMSYKFALMKMTMPEQIMTITVNHLRALLDLVPLDKDIGTAVEHAYTMAFTFYRPLGPMGWFMLRNSLLVFFQDTRVKVSTFIKDCKQLPNGRFVIFDKSAPVQLMLDGHPVGETKIQGGGLGKSDRKEGNEMALFESLMSSTTTSAVAESEIWGMSLFDNIEDEKTYMKEVAENQQITVIDAREKKKTLKAAMEEMQIDKRPPTAGEKKKKSKGASMLDMMDEAAARPATAKKGSKAKRSESIGANSTTKPAADAKPRTRSGSRPTTGARPGTKAGAEARPATKTGSMPSSKGAPRPTTAGRPTTKSSERATSATPKRAGSAKKKVATEAAKDED